MLKDVVICSACRTAIGTFNGTLSDTKVNQIGKVAIAEAVKRAGIKNEDVEEVIMGNVLQGAQGQGPGRQAAINAGIPITSPGYSLNILCGSGMKAVILGAQSILCGDTDVMVTGGMECMSGAPYLLEKARKGYRMGKDYVYDSLLMDGLEDIFNHYHMGMTAENITMMPEYKNVCTREKQDAFAYRSQMNAAAAIKNGEFKREIVGMPIKTKKGEIIFDTDEHVRPNTTLEGLAKLKPAFKRDGGTVTAGNASGINDGAAALVIMSAEKAKKMGVKPLAKITGYGTGGVDPAVMGLGPIPASQKAMKMAGVKVDDFDIIEANEAFAAQSLAVAHTLKLPMDRVNLRGGAIALGHPVGCSGARIIVTLLHLLQDKFNNAAGKKGLATLCVGGGMGVAITIETL